MSQNWRHRRGGHRELTSIFTMGSNSIFFHGETRMVITGDDPKDLMDHPANPTVQRFWTRGEEERL